MDPVPFLRNDAYRGPLQAVILDLSGTSLDHGCFGNIAAFRAAFEACGLSPTEAEIRRPMGVSKREHAAAILAMDRIAAQWQALHGSAPDDKATATVFAKLLELMPDILANYTDPVPGCVPALNELRAMGIRIGVCTAYSRSMMERLLPEAAAKGFVPDCVVASDEVARGRPWPWMCWRNCEKLDVFPPEAAVKVGDTVADIQEGVNAGHWTVGVTRSSSAIGISPEAAAAMPQPELARLEAELAERLRQAGADYVIPTIAGLPQICEQINERLKKGEKPGSRQ